MFPTIDTLFSALAVSGSGGSGNTLIRDLLVILGAASVISVLLRRLHLASIPGYLLIGAFLGTFSAKLGLVNDDNVTQISEIAVILLMFTIGLHLDIETIRTGMVPILIVGAFSTVLSGVLLWPVGMLFGLSAPAALLVGLALAMSSTAVSIGILQKNKEVHLIHGRICIGVAIMQDLLAIPLMAMIPAIALWAGKKGAVVDVADKAAIDHISGALVAIGGIIIMLAFAKFVLPRLLREASWGGNTEALLVASAGTGLAAAMLTGALGFGPALGAFLAGFMLSNTPFRFQLAGQLSPMRDLFMAVFFTAVGIKLDLNAVFQYWWVIGIGVVIVMAVKTAVIGVCTWGGGATAPISLLVGLVLGQAGEFSLVVLAEGVSRGVIEPQVSSVVIAIVVLSLIGATPLVDYGRRFMPRLSAIRPAGWIASAALRDTTAAKKHGAGPARIAPAGPSMTLASPALEPPSALAPPDESAAAAARGHQADRHVIIAGFGVVGRNVAEHLSAAGIAFSIVDLNAGTVVRQNELGRKTVYGDIANPDVLESAGLHEAEAVVITIPDDQMALRACETIRKIRPDIFVAARASYLSRAIMAHEAGADHVTIEEVVTAQDMAVKVVQQINRRFKSRAEAPHL